jgi:hypothetical protein
MIATMVTERDIWATAKMLVDRHGADAPIQAAMRADELLDRGDVDGQAVWKRILAAARELLRLSDTEVAAGAGTLDALATRLDEMFGPDAATYAAERARRLEAAGRAEAAVVWRALEALVSDRQSTRH